MNIYIDETIHEKFGFMLLAYVLCPTDPHLELAELLLNYEKDEFHALEKMEGNLNMQMLRGELKQYINSKCEWGVFVLPNDYRWCLSEDLQQFIKDLMFVHTKLSLASVYLDEGIVKPSELDEIKSKTGVSDIILCESHKVNGIQLADMVASLSGVRLREEISQLPKMLTYGDEAGFNPPIKAELGFELWADLRYSMCRCSDPLGEEMPEMAMFETMDYGLFISKSCAPELRASAEKVFGNVYLGCIH